uniref:Transmembrane protein n=1 Tax=Tetranychus urticae TaxID=32264 RepID=T1KS66_TETUR
MRTLSWHHISHYNPIQMLPGLFFSFLYFHHHLILDLHHLSSFFIILFIVISIITFLLLSVQISLLPCLPSKIQEEDKTVNSMMMMHETHIKQQLDSISCSLSHSSSSPSFLKPKPFSVNIYFGRS